MIARWLARLAVVVGLCTAAYARPGGGQSFSSGSHSYSGGGGHSYSGGGGYSYSGGGGHSYSSGGYSSGGSGGDALGVVVLVLIGIAILVVLVAWAFSDSGSSWNSALDDAPAVASKADLGALRADDPDFSRAVFEDFAFELYAAAQRARSHPDKLALLAPYVAPQAAAQLAARGSAVDQVVVGVLMAETFTRSSSLPQATIIVRIESNLAASGSTTSCVEHWQFTRALGVKTRPPARVQTWPCPNCGAPWSAADGNPRKCGHCGEAMEIGRFDWTVSWINVESETPVGATLTGTVEEVGNDAPTVVDPNAATTLASLTADDPAVTWAAFTVRVTMIYGRLNEAWNGSNISLARGLLTRAQLDYLRYWLDEYRRQDLSNHLDAAEVSNIELAKVQRDHYFDAITVRLFAAGNDYTVDSKGSVVGGSRAKARAYTEYWTFLRSSTRRGSIVATPSCPNCGAPLSISDAGACTSCNAEVESGSFDWVLSKIEQDDVYRG